MKKQTVVLILSVAVTALVIAAAPLAGAQGKSAPSGKITPWAAMKTAADKTGGRAVNATFEFEDNKWIYGVIVVHGKKLQEAEIDATTGKLGDIEDIDPAGEGKEITAELEKALKG